METFRRGFSSLSLILLICKVERMWPTLGSCSEAEHGISWCPAPCRRSIHLLLFLSLNPVWVFYDPMDSSLPDSCVQARILEWVAISSSRGYFWPRDQAWGSGHISCIEDRSFTTEPLGTPTLYYNFSSYYSVGWKGLTLEVRSSFRNESCRRRSGEPQSQYPMLV